MRFLLLAALAFAATAALPPASAATFYNGPFTLSGTAADCLWAVTPIQNAIGMVLKGFSGTINGVSGTWNTVVVHTTTMSCANSGGGWTASASGTGIAASDP